MTRRTLVWRSLCFHLRSHLGVVLGAAVGSASLIGALVVGDSVRGSLRERAESRLGAVEVALDSGDRLFSSAMLDRWPSEPAPSGLLHLRGTASRQDGMARAHGVRILGITASFQRLVKAAGEAGGASPVFPPAPGGVWLNEALAQQLSARTGDTVILRFAKPTALSPDAVVSPRNEAVAALRLSVSGIVPAAALGDLSLVSGPRLPFNAFVNLAELGAAAGATQRLNQALVPQAATTASQAATSASVAPLLSSATAALDAAWSLDDAQLAVRTVTLAGDATQRFVEVASPRIFLDPPVTAAALRPAPATNLPSGYPDRWIEQGRPVLTYLANAMRAGDRMVPYSMVTAAGEPWTPAGMGADEIVLNAWAAADLGVGVGAEVEITYFDPEAGARLLERTRRFRVRSVVPLSGLHADRTLMPEFPGLAKAESTADWDAGFPLVHRLREQDERYWKEHRGTPKALVSLEAGRQMWANRFGDATAVRYLVPSGVEAAPGEALVRRQLRAQLRPGDVGLGFRAVREEAQRAAVSGQDFGGLFLGFSFFLVTAALILMSLLFRFSVEQRLPEVGAMVAMGFTRRVIGRLWLAEGLGLALVGTLPGLWIGVAYAQGLIRGLATLWRDAVGGVPLSFHATGTGLLTGWGISMAVIAGTLALTLRGQFNRPPRALLAGELASPRIRRRSRGLGLGLVLLVASAGTAGAALLKGDGGNAGAFFGAGALALIGGVLLVSGWIARHETADTAAGVKTTTGFTLTTLAVRGITRRRSRSVSTVALLASGTFLVLAIGAFQMDAARDAGRRDSGTGGFAWIGQSALPVTVDLNADAGLEAFGLSRAELAGVNFVQARVKEGDEASCLNLDRAQRPRVVGVPAARLAELGAFRFVQTAKGRNKAEGWRLLSSTEQVGPDGIPEVPALGDAASIQWALGRKMGDGVELTDDRGRRVRLRLVAGVAPSILQGSLFIDEEAFSRWFPGEAGYRFFLIDAPAGQTEAVSGKLTRALEDVGLELVPTVRRLNEFNAVQNTYLGTFQVLGGLGLLLGSAGLGVVVLRNVLERRAELGLLAAVGFRPRRLKRMVLLEHAALLAFGLWIGAGSAALAVVPELMAGARSLPVGSLALTVTGVAVFGLLTAWWGTRAALQGRLTSALRGE